MGSLLPIIAGVGAVLHYCCLGATALRGNLMDDQYIPRPELLVMLEGGRAHGIQDIAALTSNRTNLSPFTKGCRDRERINANTIKFFPGFCPNKTHSEGESTTGVSC